MKWACAPKLVGVAIEAKCHSSLDPFASNFLQRASNVGFACQPFEKLFVEQIGIRAQQCLSIELSG